MTTPGLPLPRAVFTELGINGAWQRVATAPEFSDVLQTEPVEIERGRADEQTEMPPCALAATLLNDNGKYTNGNPNSPLYGHLGLNTPVRHGFLLAQDTFTRVVSPGWGTSDTGNVWASAGSGSDSVNGSAAIHSITGTSAFVLSRAGDALSGVYVKVDYTPPFFDITGASIEPANLVLRYQDVDNYYLVRLVATVTQTYELQILKRRNGGESFIGTGTVVVPGIVHDPAQPISVAAVIEGRTIRAKVWLASQPEPYAWQITGSDHPQLSTDLDDPILGTGQWGVRSGVAGGNTNAKPIIFTYDNMDVRVIRMSGELTGLQPAWDHTHNVKTATMSVRGLLQRLKQGDAPVRSAMRRAYDSLVGYFGDTQLPPVGYWPCEDGTRSDSIASGLTAGNPMLYNGALPEFATSTDFVCSAPLLRLNQADLTGEIAFHTNPGAYMTRILAGVPSGGTVANDVVSRLYFHNASFWFVDVMYHANGNLSVQAYDFNNALLHNTGEIFVGNVNGKNMRYQLELSQDGADVDWGIFALQAGVTFANGFGGTWAGRSMGVAARVVINPYRNIDGVTIGHIAVHKEIANIFDYFDELRGFVEETTGNRFLRLCAENGIDGDVWGYRGGAVDFPGHQVFGTPMGPQRVANIVDLLQECVATEQGIMFEALSFLGLIIRMRDTIYAQDVVLELDYSAGEVAPPLAPANDDSGLHNDITAERFLGSTFRSFKEQGSGPKNAGRPWEDPESVGPYTDRVAVNPQTDAQLKDIADQALRVGTAPETRYPQISVDLAAAEITTVQLLALLAVNIGDRVRVTDLNDADIFSSIDQIVQGYNEIQANQNLHTITFNATQYSPWDIIVLDETLLDGDVFTNEAVDATETAIDYTCSPPLETDPSVFPYNVMVGGEEWTVTSATATTLTVVRSVNEIVKSHLTGVPIELSEQSSYLGR